MNVKSLFLIFTFIVSIMLISGCTYSGEYLSVVLKENPETNEDGFYKNITNIDLTPYPTLQKALEKFFTPNNNVTRVNLKISSDESDNLLNNEIVGYKSYYNKYFRIGISTS